MKAFRANLSAAWPLLIGLAAVFILVGVLGQASRTNLPGDTLVQVTRSAVTPATNTKIALATPLSSPSPPLTETPGAESTPDFQATESFVATFVMEGQFVLATADKLLTDQPLVQEPPPTGIAEDGETAFPGRPYIIENHWRNVINGQWVYVYAGAYRSDPLQGIVVVWGGSVYPTPRKTGALRIVAEQNYRLTLISADGTTFYFDVPGQRFVDSLTEIVPTITPFRSPTPASTKTPAATITLWPTCTSGPTPSSGPGGTPCQP